MVMPSTALNGSASSQLAVVFDGTTFSAPHNGHRELNHVHREVVARAPTRIDLGGGWTDVPPYCDREGGFVCNVAIRATRQRTSRPRATRETRRRNPTHRSYKLRWRAAESAECGFASTMIFRWPRGSGALPRQARRRSRR